MDRIFFCAPIAIDSLGATTSGELQCDGKLIGPKEERPVFE